MPHNVFVSYKYSDAVNTRDKIRGVLGQYGHYYKGEKGYVALQNADDTIKEYLKDMIFNTSVTIVVISPQVVQSEWVDWEIRYSLRKTSRGEKSSNRNGIICVIQNHNNWYGNKNTDWAREPNGKYRKGIFPQAIIDNLQAAFSSYDSFKTLGNEWSYSNKNNYCLVVNEDSFMSNPSRYIEEAYNRAHDYTSYDVVVNKQVQ